MTPRSVDREDARRRIRGVTLFIPAVTCLAVARYLTPDGRGLGTHEQLGMPPCTFAASFGVECPACGLTTSVAHAVRGDVLSSMACHRGGIPIVIGLGWLAVLGCIELTGRRRIAVRTRRGVHVALFALLALGVLSTALGRWIP